jgi:N-ethylmaleimide reductase
LPNRARLLLEVIEVVAGVWGAERVGVRNSPLNSYNSMSDSDPVGLVAWLGEKLSSYGLAYWHVMRADFLGQQSGDVMSAARAAYRGVLVGNMGYSPQEAAEAIAEKKLDAVAFGTPFLANPDLPARVEAGAPLNVPDPATFYSPGPKGYTDYPAMSAG